jgi:hypothetical protein
MLAVREGVAEDSTVGIERRVDVFAKFQFRKRLDYKFKAE